MEEMDMSKQNQNDQNQMGVPYQLIYQDPQNPFANFWNAETRRMEFPFLEVSAFIEKASHRLVLQNTDGRHFSFGFLNHGEVVSSPLPNTLYLDVGNRFRKGMLDHHQWEKNLEKRRIIRNHSASSLVYHFPQMITEAIEGERSASIEIYLPKQPDFDSVAAAYLAVYYLIRRCFPTGSRFISDYTRMQDEGNTPYVDKFTLVTSPSAILYMANAINEKSLLQHNKISEITNKGFSHILDNLMLLNGLAILDRILAEFNRKNLDEDEPPIIYYTHIHKLFQRKEFSSFTDAIENDYLKYLEDGCQSPMYTNAGDDGKPRDSGL
jgi:hypothetical protein